MSMPTSFQSAGYKAVVQDDPVTGRTKIYLFHESLDGRRYLKVGSEVEIVERPWADGARAEPLLTMETDMARVLVQALRGHLPREDVERAHLADAILVRDRLADWVERLLPVPQPSGAPSDQTHLRETRRSV